MVFINGGPSCAGVKPFGGQCTLECNKGYYMTGIGTATCIDQQPNQDNAIGRWDFGDSSCEAVICSNPPTFANGYLSSSCVGDEIFKETCDLKCDQGYYMSGNGIATCEDATTADDNAIGIWDTSGSSCKDVTCSRSQVLSNGRLASACTGAEIHGNICDLECDQGFYMLVEGVAICNDTTTEDDNEFGTWNIGSAECAVVTCSLEISFSDGWLAPSCTANKTYGEKCDLGCNQGYFMSGDGEAMCDDFTIDDSNPEGNWNTDGSICKAVTCQITQILHNGHLVSECTGNEKTGEQCDLECDHGYYMSVEDVATCNDTTIEDDNQNGTWSIGVAECTAVTCDLELSFSNGRFSSSCSANKAYGEECVLECNWGYYVSGIGTATCNDMTPTDDTNMDGFWDTSGTVCAAVACPLDYLIPNGKLSSTCHGSNTFEEECDLVCNRGYYMVETGKAFCNDTTVDDSNEVGTWLVLSGFCEAVSCSYDLVFGNGRFDESCTGNKTFEEQCDLKCNEGYYMSGLGKATCDDISVEDDNTDGIWTATGSSCEVISCPPDNVMSNGRLSSSCTGDKVYTETCGLECNQGYYIVGNPMAICNDTTSGDSNKHGTWDAGDTSCEAVVCSTDPMFTNGKLSTHCSTNTSFQNDCDLKCDKGYYMSGKGKAVCDDLTLLDDNSDGTWDVDNNSCKAVTCSLEINFLNGNLSSSCIENKTYEEECDLVCFFGYYLSGFGIATCDDYIINDNNLNGSWNTDGSICEAVVCPLDLPFPNGSISLACDGSNTYEGECDLVCNTGYYMRGTREILCNDTSLSDDNQNGVWIVGDASCETVSCSPEIEFTHGTLAATCNGNKTYGEKCDLECYRGYYLSGTGKATCDDFLTNDNNRNGSWNSDGTVCESVVCPLDVTFPNGSISSSCKSNNFNDECDAICNIGYYMSGKRNVRCNDTTNEDDNQIGTWALGGVLCKAVFCSADIDFSNGGFAPTCTGNKTYGEKCELECDHGYYMAGTPIATCDDAIIEDYNKNGTWNTGDAVCKAVACKIEPIFPHGQLSSSCSGNKTYKEECNLECDRGYYMSGTGIAVCNYTTPIDDTVNGAWNTKGSYCQVVSCPLELNFTNGSLDESCSENQIYENECDLKCNWGYYMSGIGKATCDDFTVDDSNVNGSWNTTGSVCEAVVCSVDPTFPNGALSTCNGTNKFDDECDLICNKGYFMSGRGKATCNDTTINDDNPNGVWIVEGNICEAVSCALDIDFFGGKFTETCDGNKTFGEKCNLECDRGYYMMGTPTATCDDNIEGDSNRNGTWNTGDATCIVVTCGNDQKFPNGKFSVDCTENTTFGNQCDLECDQGYHMSGIGIATCNDSTSTDNNTIGTWEFGRSSCEIVYCSSDIEFANGRFDKTCIGNKTYQQQCDLICDRGYYMTGTYTASCVDTNATDDNIYGTWNTSDAACFDVSCYDDPIFENGWLSLSCSRNSTFGEQCDLKCDQGYYMLGTGVATCNDTILTDDNTNGTWSFDGSSCKVISCSPTLNFSNGELSPSCVGDRIYEEECSLECDQGYYMSGTLTATCDDIIEGHDNKNGSWNVGDAVCKSVVCSVDPLFSNGAISPSCSKNQTYGAKCKLECDQGFYMTGIGEATCDDTTIDDDNINGTWNVEDSSCEAITCPLDLEFPHGRFVSSCIGNKTHEDKCNLECDQGYHMLGTPIAICDDATIEDSNRNGTWNTSDAVCLAVTCYNNLTFKHGELSSSCPRSNMFEEQCELECDHGYYMLGSGIATCNDTTFNDDNTIGSWSTEGSLCEVISCPLKLNFSNGKLSSSCVGDKFYEEECSLECDQGYYISGSPTATCNDTIAGDDNKNGSWNVGDAVCKSVICLVDPVFLHGSLSSSCSKNQTFGATCNLECEQGYYMSGIGEATCEDATIDDDNINGTWNIEDSLCKITTCSLELEFPHGQFVSSCTGNKTYGDECNLECNQGYHMLGTPIATCDDNTVEDNNKNGTWNTSDAVCLAVTCYTNLTFEHGDLSLSCPESNDFGEQCNLECDKGYYMIGTGIATCNDTTSDDDNTVGSWSTEGSLCEVISCPIETNFTNGELSPSCVGDKIYEEECSLRCDQGYYMSGTPTAICDDTIEGHDNKNGSWDVGDAVCNGVICFTDPIFLHGYISSSCSVNKTFEAKCNLECDQGYYMSGIGLATCEDTTVSDDNVNGTWNIGESFCEIITCSLELEFPYGQFESSCYGNKTYGDTCNLECDQGYFMLGIPVATCDDTTVEDSNKNGTWNTSDASCLAVTCFSNLTFDHGGLSSSCPDSIKFEEQCDLKCDQGYYMIGTGEAFCNDTSSDHDNSIGTWSTIGSICEIITCSTELKFSYGQFDSRCVGNKTYGDECNLECYQGYHMLGTPIATCDDTTVEDNNKNGMWNTSDAVCLAVTCYTNLTFEHGELSLSCPESNQFGEQCNLECDKGYYIIGTAIATCNDTTSNDNNTVGAWSTEGSLCEVISCPIKANFSNGELSSSCVGDKIYEEECSLECDQGYYMSGTPTAICDDIIEGHDNKNGSWDVGDAVCNAVTCFANLTFDHGGLSSSCPDSIKFKEQCDLKCDQGYYMIGTGKAICNDTSLDHGNSIGTWSTIGSICEIITCSTELDFPYGRFASSCVGNKTYGDKCNLECNQGYHMLGTPIATCDDTTVEDNNKNGTWNTSDAVCLAVTCYTNLTFEHGELSLSCPESNEFGEQCNLECDKGYYIIGTGTATCNDSTSNDNNTVGAWSTEGSLCEVISCPIKSNFSNGDLSPSCVGDKIYEEECSLECDQGYYMSGTPTAICDDTIEGHDNKNGSWDVEDAVCNAVTCFANLTFDHGGLSSSCPDSIKFKEQCDLKCDQGYYMIGTGKAICNDTSSDHGNSIGTWSTIGSICEIITCSTELDFPYGWFASSCVGNKTYGDKCNLECNQGYHMLGTPIATCDDTTVEDNNKNGTWNTSDAVCLAVTCYTNLTFEHGELSLSCPESNEFGKQCNLECDKGYYIIGTGIATCNDTTLDDNNTVGSWSTEGSFCEVISCPVKANFSNGNLSSSCVGDKIYEEECSLECDQGYYMSGTPTAICDDTIEGHDNKNGSWDVGDAVCKAVICSTDPIFPHGYISSSCSVNQTFGAKCNLECDQGYYMSGIGIATCEDTTVSDDNINGTWNIEGSFCDSITCSLELEFPYGQFESSCVGKKTYGDTCNLECDKGFYMLGIPVATCDDATVEDSNNNGTWNTSVASCLAVTCFTNLTFVHGGLSSSCPDSNKFGEQCDLECDQGYFMIGTGIATCNDTTYSDENSIGTWSTKESICEVVTCSTDLVFEHGELSSSCTGTKVHQQQCNLECDEGYYLSGWRNATCYDSTINDNNHNDTWDTGDTECLLVTCSEEPDFPNGGLSPSCVGNKTFSEECLLDCEQGYYMFGSGVAICKDITRNDTNQNGYWSVDGSSCEPVLCTTDFTLSNAKILPSCMDGMIYKEQCELECFQGYYMSGPGIATCSDSTTLDNNKNGTWDATGSVCEIVTCSINVAFLNGNLSSSCTGRKTYGEECELECFQGYHMLGIGKAICNDTSADDSNIDGTWNIQGSHCEAVVCSTDLEFENGSFTSSCVGEIIYQDVCELECDQGYYLSGSGIATCIDRIVDDGNTNGTWDTGENSCIAVKCPNDTDLLNGGLSPDCEQNKTYGDQCQLKCNQGYYLSGSRTATCIDNTVDDKNIEGSWNTTGTECKAVTCPVDTDFSSQKFFLSCKPGIKSGEQCGLTCNLGYSIEGNNKATCLDITVDDTNSKGTWDTGSASCLSIDECAVGIDDCDVNAECFDTEAGYFCVCNIGYVENGIYCEDIDECDEETDNCHVNADCRNTDGSFSCKCKPEYTGDGVDCSALPCDVICTGSNQGCIDDICSCMNGYENANGTCIKVCPTSCTANSECYNVDRGCECVEGYTKKEYDDSFLCEDVDECESKKDEPGINCTNYPGHYTLECREGYYMEGNKCKKQSPECPPSCGQHASCRDPNRGCECSDGWGGDKDKCEDIDECLYECSEPTLLCTNTPGSFYCTCIAGYYRETEIDECIPDQCKETSVSCVYGPDGACNVTSNITFPTTLLGYSNKTINVCGEETPNAGTPFGTRLCDFDGNWVIKINWLSSCYVGLQQLLEQKISTEEDREEVSSNLEMVTSTPDELSSDDIETTTDVIENVTDTDILTQEVATSIVSAISNIMESPSLEESGECASLLRQLDEVSTKVELFEGKPFTVVSNNVSMTSVNSNYSPYLGFGVAVFIRPNRTSLGFRSDQFIIIHESRTAGDIIDKNTIEASIYVPVSAQRNNSRTVVYVFGNDNLFPRQRNAELVNATAGDVPTNWNLTNMVLTASTGEEDIVDLPWNDSLSFSTSGNDESICAFWKESIDDWSTSGCIVDNNRTSNTSISCSCNHMTSFATLIDATGKLANYYKSLGIITVVGCSISSVALFFVIAAFLLIPKMRKGARYRSAYLLSNLSVALLCLNITLIVSEYVDESSCPSIAALLHLFMMSACGWMNCEAVALCIAILMPIYSKMQVRDSRVASYSIVWGWIMPFVFISAVLIWDASVYQGETCWIQTDLVLYLAAIPVSVLILFNLILYGILTYKLCRKRESLWEGQSREMSHNRSLPTKKVITNICIMMVVGVTWVFGFFINIFSHNETAAIVFAYIFTILNSLQGFFIFLLYIVRSRDVRDEVGKRTEVLFNLTASSAPKTTSSETLSKFKTNPGRGKENQQVEIVDSLISDSSADLLQETDTCGGEETNDDAGETFAQSYKF
uniref:uncharacterized protein LOC120335372 n=1 Tax=Styela clava TaxID=7725 RepID=UPI0019394544|nr:uncharacterized protein LOC120335372 [Styela clava]